MTESVLSRVTQYLALYGAALSTFVFLWNVARARPKIRVKLSPGVDTVNGELVSGLHVSVQNVSAHTVHLSNVSILYPYTAVGLKDRLRHLFKFRRLPRRIGWVHTSLSNFELEDGCPISLDARKSHGFLIPDDALNSMLGDAIRKEVRAVAQDELWANTYSGILEIDWLNPVQESANGT